MGIISNGNTIIDNGAIEADEVDTTQLVNDAVDNTKLDLSDDYTFTGKISGQNYPAFYAYLGSSQSPSNNTATKVQINTEIFDSDSCYDNATNYRFTPTVAGKYFVYCGVTCEAQTGNKLLLSQALIYKNGAEYTDPSSAIAENNITRLVSETTAVVDMNGTSDYVEFFAKISVGAGSGQFNSGTKRTHFGAFRLGD